MTQETSHVTQTGTAAPLNPERILQTGLGFGRQKRSWSAVELEISRTLAEKPSTADDLRQRLGCTAIGRSISSMHSVALGFLQRNAGVYAEHT